MTSRSLIDNSFIDDVTGLWNRKTFMENLDTEAYRSKRYNSELTLCLLQLNHPDSEKSEPGNGLSEENLRAMSATLTQGLRKSDGLGRLDDGLFACMLPQTKVAEARVIVTRALQSFQDTLTANADTHVEMSLGLAAYRLPANEYADDLYARAEENLRSLASSDKSA